MIEPEEHRDIEAMAGRLTWLWGRLRDERASRQLAGTLAALSRSHRRLALRDQRLPATLAVERYRRNCVEALQADTRNVEMLGARLSALTCEVQALADRQLAATRDHLAGPPPIQRAEAHQRGAELPGPLLVIGLMLVVMWMTHSPWWAFAAYCAPILIGFARPFTRLSLEFDGRRLRMQRRAFGLRCWLPRTVDLARFNHVVVTDRPAHHFSGERCWRTRVALRAGGVEMEVDKQTKGREIECLAWQLREWCAAAVREAR